MLGHLGFYESEQNDDTGYLGSPKVCSDILLYHCFWQNVYFV